MLKNLGKVEEEVRTDDGGCYVMRAVPYRTADNRIEGVVVAFADVSRLKETENELRKLNAALEERVEERTSLARRRAEKLQQLAVRLTHTEQIERQRLAGILHDDLQQSLVVAGMKTAQLRDNSQAESDAETAQQVLDVLQNAIHTTRTLNAKLCPTVLFQQGLSEALHWLGGHLCDERGLEVSVETDSDAEPRSKTVKTLLFRCAQELLVNVAKHAETNRAAVRLSSRAGSHFILQVEDRGKGFDTEDLSADGEDPAAFGLFSIRERVEAVGGSMVVRSQPGEGTRVTLDIPVRDNLLQTGKREGAPLTPSHHGPHRKAGPTSDMIRIVLADDHVLVRRSLISMLEDAGRFVVVGEATNGRQAVETVLQEAPDLVLMDVSMPEIDGVAATRQLREAGFEAPIIGLSVHDEEQIAQGMLDAGANGYVNKGDPPQTLLDAIADCRAAQE